MTKYEIIDTLIVEVNQLADAHGVTKCTGIIKALQGLGELKAMLQEEEREEAAQNEDA